ncbi:MAG: putative porin [Verrucomicrobiia bacterium]
MTINLINRLVERGVLSAEDAKELIQQAETDAAEARAQALKTDTNQATNDGDTVHVPYVPEIVKVQIRDEIEDDVLQHARAEHWAATNALPAWASQYVVKGDIRVRYEDFIFPKGNNTTGVFPNFNAINTGSPFDTTGVDGSPQRDVDHNRVQVRLRARLGTDIDLKNGFTAGLRLATGTDDQPVSVNQSLGTANGGQGGDFSKYAVWLDQAFIKYELGGLPTEDLAISVGRFDKPFFSTSIIWYDNLAFDGLAVQGRKQLLEGVTPFFNVGAFPIFDTDLNFSSNRPQKYPSEDRWLYGGQVGTDWKINDDFSFKGAAAFYYFANIAGKLSSPFVPLTSADQGNTDDTRPAFAQFGNTYMNLRDITPTAANDFGAIDQWQYFGLASSFHDLAFTGKLDYEHFQPFIVSLNGEFVENIAFDAGNINATAVNNRGPDLPNGNPGPFVGGGTAWIGGINLGSAALQKRWDWNLAVNYRYVESDSVVDGFCEPDFGGGGTNVKGYTIRAWLAIEPNIYFGLNWMSSDQVAGPTLKADTFWLDANAAF